MAGWDAQGTVQKKQAGLIHIHEMQYTGLEYFKNPRRRCAAKSPEQGGACYSHHGSTDERGRHDTLGGRMEAEEVHARAVGRT